MQVWKQHGFTLIELLIVIAIIALLSGVVLASLSSTREKGKASTASATARAVQQAVETYDNDMGFYPPDTGRGWDPGFMQPLPYNPDTEDSTLPSCGHCPAGWDSLALSRWDGPYLSVWPRQTPWGGKYDYNYWETPTDRYGCMVPAGIYIGIQGDYDNSHQLSSASEQKMLDMKIDNDGCLNGEAQMLLLKL